MEPWRASFQRTQTKPAMPCETTPYAPFASILAFTGALGGGGAPRLCLLFFAFAQHVRPYCRWRPWRPQKMAIKVHRTQSSHPFEFCFVFFFLVLACAVVLY